MYIFNYKILKISHIVKFKLLNHFFSSFIDENFKFEFKYHIFLYLKKILCILKIREEIYIILLKSRESQNIFLSTLLFLYSICDLILFGIDIFE